MMFRTSTNQPLSLTPGQRVAIRPSPRKHLVFGRQCGLTTVMLAEALLFGQDRPGTFSAVVEPSQTAARAVFKAILQHLAAPEYVKTTNPSRLAVQLTNGSTVAVLSNNHWFDHARGRRLGVIGFDIATRIPSLQDHMDFIQHFAERVVVGLSGGFMTTETGNDAITAFRDMPDTRRVVVTHNRIQCNREIYMPGVSGRECLPLQYQHERNADNHHRRSNADHSGRSGRNGQIIASAQAA